MKKIIAILPHHVDWSTALKDGLVFGITAAFAIHVLPAISRAFLASIGRAGGSATLAGALLGLDSENFGQRR